MNETNKLPKQTMPVTFNNLVSFNTAIKKANGCLKFRLGVAVILYFARSGDFTLKSPGHYKSGAYIFSIKYLFR